MQNLRIGSDLYETTTTECAIGPLQFITADNPHTHTHKQTPEYTKQKNTKHNMNDEHCLLGRNRAEVGTHACLFVRVFCELCNGMHTDSTEFNIVSIYGFATHPISIGRGVKERYRESENE